MLDIQIDTFYQEKEIEVTLGIIECTVKVMKTPKDLLTKIRLLEDTVYENKDTYLKKRQEENKQVYRTLGKDPNRYPNSANALIKRICKRKELYHIHNVVDVNNLISIQFGLSVGSYDIDCLEGPIRLGIAQKTDSYQGIGKDELHLENLPILKDKKGLFGSPTSDSRRAMITEKTENIMMVIYGLGENILMEEIIREAQSLLEKYCKAKTFHIKIITNKEN